VTQLGAASGGCAVDEVAVFVAVDDAAAADCSGVRIDEDSEPAAELDADCWFPPCLRPKTILKHSKVVLSGTAKG
jgi:hypothetical protein